MKKREDLPKFMSKFIEWKSLDQENTILKQASSQYEIQNKSHKFQMVVMNLSKLKKSKVYFFIARLTRRGNDSSEVTYKCVRISKWYKYVVAMNSRRVKDDITNCHIMNYDKENVFIAG